MKGTLRQDTVHRKLHTGKRMRPSAHFDSLQSIPFKPMIPDFLRPNHDFV
jgi:hypothetical protein